MRKAITASDPIEIVIAEDVDVLVRDGEPPVKAAIFVVVGWNAVAEEWAGKANALHTWVGIPGVRHAVAVVVAKVVRLPGIGR